MLEQHRCGAAGVPRLDAGAVEQSVPARFGEVVGAHRDCLAVEDAGRRMTYGRLEMAANGVARAIASRGGDAGTPVILLHHQGIDSVVAILGTLMAGRPYAPLDPSAPPAYLEEIADRLGASLVLTDGESASSATPLGRPGREILRTDDPALEADEAPPVTVGPDALAYVYFTSGSTGSPKGVVDTHRNVLHNAMRYTATLEIGPSDRLSLLQSPSLSAVVSSTFGALLNGAALFPMRVGGRIDALAATVRERRITIYHSVPSIFRSMVAVDGGTFRDVRAVRLEGDRASSLDVALHRRHFPPGGILANGLGTTETGLCRQLRLATTDPISEGILPVGYPVPGVGATVVDSQGRSLPVGEAGEIAIRGRHLALGYWGRPDLTEGAFGPDPDDPGGRVYRTGDLGRLRPDGCLEYLGRRDGQLKVLGQRVEPAEIEAHLLALPGVREAAVTTYPGRRGEGRLAAHVVVDEGGLDHLAMRAALLERLPPAMVPATLAFVASLPLTGSGKIDRAALVAAPAAPSSPPRGGDEAALLDLWERVLERTGLGVDDDFFASGGDSLSAAELVVALEGHLGHPPPEGLLVRAPTVARMAAELGGDQTPRPATGVVPLQPLGTGAPLVLVHGVDFSVNTYAWLVRRLGVERPVWGLDASPARATSIAALARDHATVLRAAHPEGPHLLAAFCSGAIVAAEIARALRAEGADVALLALFGVGAADFPGLISPAAAERHRATRRPLARLRDDGARALAGEVRAAAGRRLRRAPGDPVRVTLAGHAPARIPGHATLYLSATATAAYSDDPVADWAGLADTVHVEVLPGENDGLLREPVVGDLAGRIRVAVTAAG